MAPDEGVGQEKARHSVNSGMYDEEARQPTGVLSQSENDVVQKTGGGES